MRDFSGQVAIVTGGGRGIGRAIAFGLAKVDAFVAVVAWSADQLAETVRQFTQLGCRAISVAAYVSDSRAIEKMVQRTDPHVEGVEG